MAGFVTKQELAKLVEKTRELDVFPDKDYLRSFGLIHYTSEAIAQDIFEGKLNISPEELEKAIETELQRREPEKAV